MSSTVLFMFLLVKNKTKNPNALLLLVKANLQLGDF